MGLDWIEWFSTSTSPATPHPLENALARWMRNMTSRQTSVPRALRAAFQTNSTRLKPQRATARFAVSCVSLDGELEVASVWGCDGPPRL